jgi:hypothetical protein
MIKAGRVPDEEDGEEVQGKTFQVKIKIVFPLTLPLSPYFIFAFPPPFGVKIVIIKC